MEYIVVIIRTWVLPFSLVGRCKYTYSVRVYLIGCRWYRIRYGACGEIFHKDVGLIETRFECGRSQTHLGIKTPATPLSETQRDHG